MFSNEMSAARQNEPSIKTFQTKTGENNSGWASKKGLKFVRKRKTNAHFCAFQMEIISLSLNGNCRLDFHSMPQTVMVFYCSAL